MEIIVTEGKWKEVRDFINLWLKEPNLYCNYCGRDYDKYDPEICCENPQIGSNFTICKALIEQNKQIKASRANSFASDDKKILRYSVSLPPRLLMDLEKAFKVKGQKLFDNSEELHQFMKKFPQFCIPKDI
jgi:hypothetical protein